MQPNHGSSTSFYHDDSNMSSISFNSRVIDQYRHIGDSVSQIGANDLQTFDDPQQQMTSLDLGSVTVELKLREQKIKDL